MSFNHRSYEKELLDRQDIPFADIQRNMQELDFINKNLGGHQITIKGLKKIAGKSAGNLRIAEIGCGGGNNLRVVQQWCKRNKIKVELIGIDINPECISFAKAQASNEGIHFICSDYREVVFTSLPNVIFSSLFCHHFNDDELVLMMQWMHRNSAIGFFINDLHRHPLAYQSIRVLTGLFSKSYLVKNDAPLSVKRGFSRKEWEQIFERAGITSFQITWQWAFRWLILCRK